MSEIKILIVDDQNNVRQSLGTILRLIDGFRVVGEAGEGSEAIRLAEQLAPDVVLMDMSMSGPSSPGPSSPGPSSPGPSSPGPSSPGPSSPGPSSPGPSSPGPSSPGPSSPGPSSPGPSSPGLDGIEASRSIKRRHPGIGVVMLTMHGSEQSRQRAAESGVDAFVEKGITMEELSETIRRVHRSKEQAR